MIVRWTITGFITLFLLQNSSGHDLCVDDDPPQDYSDVDFELCGRYRSMGCCDKNVERIVVERYQNAIASRDLGTQCKKYIADIFCQRCSPRSAHLFEGDFNIARRHPRLCKSFCTKLRHECGSEVERIFGNEICQDFDSDINCYPNSDSKHHHKGHHSGGHSDCIPVCLQKVVTGVKNIVDGAFPPDGSVRLFLVQQDGIVWELDSGRNKLPEPFLDIRERTVQPRGTDERGLLSMVFHPNFARNKEIYLFYNPSGSRTVRSRVVRMKVSDPGSPMKIDPNSEEIILEYEKPSSNHNGGQLLFGNDGYLYISVGDGGGQGDRHGAHGNGQNLSTLLGKILRIDVNTKFGYDIPGDNPFVHETGNIRKEIYAYGFRNPWRMSIDRKTGTIFAGDVGQRQIEEVDIVVKGGNYGWRTYEGEQCFDRNMCTDERSETIDPIYWYTHKDGLSVIGGFVYRGNAVPELKTKYVFGDNDMSPLWVLEKSGEFWVKKNICVGKETCPVGTVAKNPEAQLFGFTEDQQGELYIFVADTNSGARADGSVYKIVPPIS